MPIAAIAEVETELASTQRADEAGPSEVVGAYALVPPAVRALQTRAWALLDDPSSSVPARHVSFFIMAVIALSVIAFTLESVPWDCKWVDRHETATLDGEEVVLLSYAPTRLCSELTEACPRPRSPSHA